MSEEELCAIPEMTLPDDVAEVEDAEPGMDDMAFSQSFEEDELMKMAAMEFAQFNVDQFADLGNVEDMFLGDDDLEVDNFLRDKQNALKESKASQLQALTVELEDHKKQVRDLKHAKDVSETQVEKYKKIEETLNKQIQKLKSEIETINKELAMLTENNQKLMENIEQTNKQMKDLREKDKESQDMSEAMKSAVNSEIMVLEQKLKFAESKIETLSERPEPSTVVAVEEYTQLLEKNAKDVAYISGLEDELLYFKKKCSDFVKLAAKRKQAAQIAKQKAMHKRQGTKVIKAGQAPRKSRASAAKGGQKERYVMKFKEQGLGIYIRLVNNTFLVGNVGRGTAAHVKGLAPGMLMERIIDGDKKEIVAENLEHLSKQLREAKRPLFIHFIRNMAPGTCPQHIYKPKGGKSGK